MIVFTFANEKGGVAKTALSFHAAAGMAARGKRVLYVDSDAQATATYGTGLEEEPGFYNLVVRDAEWKDVLKIINRERYGIVGTAGHMQTGMLAVLPGNGETQLIANKIDRIDLIAERLSELEDHVDVVVFDTSPTPSLLHGAIYMATDVLIYPTQCEPHSLKGLLSTIRNREAFDRMRRNMFGKGIMVGGIIPTMFRQKTVEHTTNRNELKKQFGSLVWEPVADRITWPEASFHRIPVYSYAPNSPAADDAWEVIDRTMEVLAHV